MARYSARELAMLAGLSCMWGVSYLFIGHAVQRVSPILFAAIRFDIVFLVLLGGVAAARTGLLPRGRASWTAVGVGALLNIGIYHALLFWGQTATSPAIAALLVGLNPVLTMLLTRLLMPEERLDARTAVGVGLGFAGMLVLALLKPGNWSDAAGIAELAVGGAILAWALGTVVARRTGHQTPLVTFVAWQAGLGAAVLHVLSLLFEPAPRLGFDAWTVVGLGYLTLVASCLGLLLFFALLERVGPTRSNVVSYGAAVVTAVTGLLFLGHPIEPRALLAFALILGGFGVMASARRVPVARSDPT